jgi:type IV pilus assembly protein PilB
MQRFVGSTELFVGSSDDLLARLTGLTQVVRYAAGTMIFEQGGAASHLYLIYAGLVELRRSDPLSGRDFVLAMYSPGKSFGEEGVLLEEGWSATAMAAEDTTLVAVPREVFRQAMVHSPTIGIGAARIMARRANRLLSEKGVRFIQLTRINLDTELLRLLPQRLMLDSRVVPIARRGQTVSVAMVNPHDVVAVDEVQRHLRSGYVEVFGVTQPDFDTFVNRHVVSQVATEGAEPNVLAKLPQRQHQLRFIQDGEAATADAQAKGDVAGEQVIALLNQLLGDAFILDVSDVHIEPAIDGTVVRYRVDGRLLRRPETIQPRFHNPLVTRIKALASMNISERRRPQDGRLSIQVGQREVALRISTIPTRFGEKCVLRVLDRSAALMSLDRIVTVPTVRQQVRQLCHQPHGIVMVTGPTGSGKTTTMYSAILERKNDGLNIVTIEDPIEYTIPGITQVQYNDSVELGYADAIKAFMRQDPDIMLIGETRDGRTARNAMQAALSGHLVVTSFHTNSALSTIYRLQEMGVEPFLIGNALAGIVAQRLVRTVCTDCREPGRHEPAVMHRIYGSAPASEWPQVFQGAGCARCNQTGFRGRTAILEVLPITPELRTAIATAQPMRELRRVAIAGGMTTFRDYAKSVLTRGLTTPAEVARILFTDDEDARTDGVRCHACGTINPTGNRFCEECGATIEAPRP